MDLFLLFYGIVYLEYYKIYNKYKDYVYYKLMFYYLLLITLIICNSSKPKFCINCKYYIKSYVDDKYSTCALSRNTQFIGTYVVTGLYDKNEYMHCTTERSDHGICGVNATRYKKKYVRKNKL